MKLFVYEYVCGGGWPGRHLGQSLSVEGAAMLGALCEDLSRLPGIEVTTTVDVRCPVRLPPQVHVVPVDSHARGQEELLHQSLVADATIVIAPELDNILAKQVRALRAAGANVIALPDGWIEMCSDKRHLLLHGVPMIPTFPLEQNTPHNLSSEHVVIKPAFGAGSQTISVLPIGELERLRTPPRTLPLEQLIVQPWIPGTALSVGVLANALGERTILPVARQRLSDDGYLQYQGGSIPWTGAGEDAIRQIVRRCLDHLSDVRGYIGFDFLLPDADPQRPLLVEINPRLCTSYLGYRRLTDDNLAALMLPCWPKQRIGWRDRVVTFQPDGTFELAPMTESLPCA